MPITASVSINIKHVTLDSSYAEPYTPLPSQWSQDRIQLLNMDF